MTILKKLVIWYNECDNDVSNINSDINDSCASESEYETNNLSVAEMRAEMVFQMCNKIIKITSEEIVSSGIQRKLYLRCSIIQFYNFLADGNFARPVLFSEDIVGQLV